MDGPSLTWTLESWFARLPRRDWLAWVLCATVIAAAVAVRIAFPLLGAFITFYPAVVICTMIAGYRAGLLTLAIGLAISPFFIGPAPPGLPLWPFLSWLFFAAGGYAMLLIVDAQQRGLAKSRQLTEQLTRQQHFTDHVISVAPSLTYVYDVTSGHNVFISPQCLDILGHSTGEIAAMGRDLLPGLIHPDDMPLVQERISALRPNSPDALPDVEYRMRRKDGAWVWLLSRDRVFARDENGRPTQILGVATDITSRKRSEEQLQASEERFRGIFENAPIGISISDMEGNFVQCNPAYERMLGYDMAELRNLPFSTLVHPDDRAANLAEMDRLVRQEVPHFEIFNRSVHKSGRTVWVHKVILLLRDRMGQPVNMVALLTDMTERKRSEEQIRLLMREVNHRSKNLLAVVQSVARQTAAYGDPETFAERFAERLQGLAASHDLLVHNAWQGVVLADLVRSQLAHLEDLVGRRIALSGPELHINATAAQSLGMALHELAVNAGKHGALSGAEGRVEISWRLLGDAPEEMIELSWREHGGPPVAPPRRAGLGTLILTRLAEQSLGARVVLKHEAEGLSWTLTAPLAAMRERDLFVRDLKA
ncbi:sensor histidine kinase [Aestuariivirga sp.]|uniref:sensor histidine kinase n=1 Tax=Aestuariivirga sp. TaxID=2650926 RepID=UPI00391BCB29